MTTNVLPRRRTPVARVRHVRTGLAAGLAFALSACAGDREVVAPAGVTATATTAATAAWPTVHLLADMPSAPIMIPHAAYPPPDQRYVLDPVALVTRLQAVYGDIGKVDFLVVMPTKPLITHTASVANRSITGIGPCPGCSLPAAPQLKSVAEMAFYADWAHADSIGFDPMLFFSGFQNSLLHELGHYWLVNITNFGTTYPGHYTNTLDLFYGDTTHVDPLAGAHWTTRAGRAQCVSFLPPSTSPRFSDVSLYLMGLIPPEQVAPVTQYKFASIPGDPAYNAAGPLCGQPYKIINKRTVTIQDIIATHGVRTPSSAVSQKNFTVMFVVVHPAGEPPPDGFVAYAGAFADVLPTTWAEATRFRSGMKIAVMP